MGEFITGFYTAELLQDPNLTSTAQIVYVVLTTINNQYRHINISNDMLLQTFGHNMSEHTLQRALALLEKYGYIKREIITEPGHQNERIITILK
ncbi:MAG: helix-turn-helix domain-containing protein [Alphaproteobacteria bacterium]|nr:helix-turn-helix domain-containing protein [Alphaproteobacteria bacterium]